MPDDSATSDVASRSEANGGPPVSAPVVIVGAGLAGLACAAALREAGITPLVLDKARGPGGRLSTRRTDAGRFDHGAPVLHPGVDTGPDAAFSAAAERWRKAGLVADWPAASSDSKAKSLVGIPAMNEIIRHEASATGVAFSTRAAPFGTRQDGVHVVRTEAGEVVAAAPFVVVATPAEQAAELLHEASAPLAALARTAISAPCWTAMLGLSVSVADRGHIWSAPEDGIAKAVRDSAKPGRAVGERWVVHATTEWTKAHLEDDATAVASLLGLAFCNATKRFPADVHFSAAHRWRYATVETAATGPFGFDPETNLACCGDWLIGPAAGDAWASGTELGQALASKIER